MTEKYTICNIIITNMARTTILIFIILIQLLMNSCSRKTDADLIITDATVFILDSDFSTVESFAVADGKIAATGASGEIFSRYVSKNVVNASGKFVYPGFNDAHCHLNGYGENLVQYADLRGTTAPEEIYKIIKEHYNKFQFEWVLGRNWDQNDWENNDFPDKSELDELFPEIPVFLLRVDGHACWCNSKALQLAGITADTEVRGGLVELKDGEPTGILIDKAISLVSEHIPEISQEDQKRGLLEAQRNCFAAGLTSVTDCGLNKETVLLIEELQNTGELKMRINAMISPSDENIEHFVKKGPHKSEFLTVNTIKIFADGALGSRGALLLEEYSDDPGNKGLQMYEQDYYDNICKIAYDNNFAVATHCIGDSANRLILNTYGKFLKGKNDRRWRIEHAQIINPDDFELFNKFSIVPSVQATHATSDMYWAADRLGDERLKGAYAYSTLLRKTGWLPNGTDFPVENIEPLFTFYASVFRRDHKGWPEGGWLSDECLSREDALRSITIWPAMASFEEEEKGSLEVGKYADFVILDTNLMTASPNEILRVKVESIWIGGKEVFDFLK